MSKEMLKTEWEYVRKSHKSGLETKRLPASFSKEIRLGFDDGANYCLLCELDADSKNRETVEVADGLKLSARDFEVNGRKRKYLVISCSETRFEVFVLFAAEFLKLMDDRSPEDAFYQTFKEWKKFWAGKRPPLSVDEQRGLIGELYIIEKLHELTDGKIIDAWEGPMDGLHDYESDLVNLEIKTTTREPPIIRISQIEQLTPLESKDFFLIVVQITNEDSGTSLVDFVERVGYLIPEDTAEMETYAEKLKRAGYQKRHELHYGRRFSIRNILFCPITGETPILKPEILGKVPSTVTKIGYNLNVSGLDRFTPTEENWKEIGDRIVRTER